ncbi:MAG: hypothetical protein IPF54_13545 [Draconibacterium sp.]|nr:hypothetical protein [Draconibacterium sp.]
MNFQIEKSGVGDHLGAGIVLTGGTSNLDNIISLVKFRTGLDARKGNLVLGLNEKHKELQNSDIFTALGLLNLTAENKIEKAELPIAKPEKIKKPKEPGKLSPGLIKLYRVFLIWLTTKMKMFH